MNKLALTVLVLAVLVLGINAVGAHGEHDMHETMEPCNDEHMDEMPSGNEFAHHHVVQMAHMGMLGKEHNPGMHMGFSSCLH